MFTKRRIIQTRTCEGVLPSLILPNRGKSGGARVIYVDFTHYEKIYLVTVYAKSEMENLSRAEQNELKALVEILESELIKNLLLSF